jgi:signal transduction histidine kinase
MKTKKDIRVLIVEDDYPVSEMVHGLLKDLGYSVIGEAVNGFEAVEMTQSLQPDIVLMDIRIPGINGLEAARRINDSFPTPIVVLTAYETEDLLREASDVGVGAYLVKPPEAGELERAITIAMTRFDDMMKLRRLNDDLEARNEELDAFAYIVAHDLQNPLANITGFAEILRKHCDSMSSKELKEHLLTMEQIGRKMSDAIEQLLLLARSHQEDVDMIPLDMAAIVEGARQRLAYVIEDQGATIVLPDSWPVARGHGPWVEEVWVNYLSNAIKYGARPPLIELGANLQANGEVQFWVSDNGYGISEEDQARLFTPFTRLDDDTTKGYGLGLAIVRRIVKRLGGKASVESAIGEGSIFAFTLPGTIEE